MGLGCCLFFIVPLTNVLLIASCSNLLAVAKSLQEYPGSTKHGDEWVNKLVTWSIVGICVGVIQTVFSIFWLWFVGNLPEESKALRNSRILFAIVQAILVTLVLVALIVPGIDMWPDSYRETDWVMYSAIWFIVIYLVGLIAAVRSVLIKPNPHSINAA